MARRKGLKETPDGSVGAPTRAPTQPTPAQRRLLQLACAPASDRLVIPPEALETTEAFIQFFKCSVENLGLPS